jgi:hypothetical protein
MITLVHALFFISTHQLQLACTSETLRLPDVNVNAVPLVVAQEIPQKAQALLYCTCVLEPQGVHHHHHQENIDRVHQSFLYSITHALSLNQYQEKPDTSLKFIYLFIQLTRISYHQSDDVSIYVQYLICQTESLLAIYNTNYKVIMLLRT